MYRDPEILIRLFQLKLLK